MRNYFDAGLQIMSDNTKHKIKTIDFLIMNC